VQLRSCLLANNFKGSTVQYKGHPFETNNRGAFCDHCEEGFVAFDARQEKAWLAFREIVDSHEAAELARIRKKLKLTQMQARQLAGGGKNAFSRYERGHAKGSSTASFFTSRRQHFRTDFRFAFELDRKFTRQCLGNNFASQRRSSGRDVEVIACTHNWLAAFGFQRLPRIARDGAALSSATSISREAWSIFTPRNLAGTGFAEHGEDKLQVGHVVAQIVTCFQLREAFDLLMTFRCDSERSARDLGGKDGAFFAFLDTMASQRLKGSASGDSID
jgi:putative zinc finger/helix-turn-helix YgiT family protein